MCIPIIYRIDHRPEEDIIHESIYPGRIFWVRISSKGVVYPTHTTYCSCAFITKVIMLVVA